MSEPSLEDLGFTLHVSVSLPLTLVDVAVRSPAHSINVLPDPEEYSEDADGGGDAGNCPSCLR